MSVFKNLLASLEHFFTGIGKDVLAFVSALTESIAQNGGAVLVNAAAEAVRAAEGAGGSGAFKLQSAQAAVIKVLQDQGIPVVLNAVNGAIEAAVAQVKLNQAPAATVAIPAEASA